MFDFFRKNKSKSFVEKLSTAVFTTKFVINEKRTITYVTHDIDDGVWQFFSEDDFDSFEEVAMIVSLEQIIEIDKSILEISDLPLGCVATRKDKNDKWKISQNK
jgi:hypothetical protein